MNLQTTIKDQCERNRDKHDLDIDPILNKYALTRTDLDQITQQTAEAVLSAVVEMVGRTFNGYGGTLGFTESEMLNLLTKLTNKDV